MRSLAQSYLGVNYELRPAKQVERRMIVDALHLLALRSLQIRDYQYTGLGSIYFVDFVLFHRLLGIQRMLTVERDESIERRVRFNKPFDCVKIAIAEIGDVIPNLSPDIKHLLWLDYDYRLQEDQLTDVRLAASRLSRGSILLVTVDVEPPGQDADGPEDWYAYFQEQTGDLFDPSLPVGSFAASDLPLRNAGFLRRAIDSGLAARSDVDFLPVFSFLYADGHRMLTIGGIIGAEEERGIIDGSKLRDLHYTRLDSAQPPYEIRIPKVTRKERLCLDQYMPCPNGWCPDEFEFTPEDAAAYREIYRFFPAYAELLL